MKKSDLIRRSINSTRKVHLYGTVLGNTFADGFESGYRAARADLRRELIPCDHLDKKGKIVVVGVRDFMQVVIDWLRPIR